VNIYFVVYRVVFFPSHTEESLIARSQEAAKPRGFKANCDVEEPYGPVCADGVSHPPPSHPSPTSSCTSPRLWWVILNPDRLLSRRPHHTVARLQPPGARRGLGAWCSISDGARGGWSRRGRGRGLGSGGEWWSSSSSSSKPHPSPSPVNVHTAVCADTIPLVLLFKELILVWPRAAQPLFAPQNERIINSETESNVFFPFFFEQECVGPSA